jgi:hypothetical protein
LENEGVDWVDNSRGYKIGRALSSDEQQMRAMYRRWHELITLGRVSHPVNL